MKLLKFGTDWCNPCKTLSSVLKTSFGDDSLIQNMVEYNMDKDFVLAKQYSIRSIPTLVLIDDKGGVVRTLSKCVSVEGIGKFLNGV